MAAQRMKNLFTKSIKKLVPNDAAEGAAALNLAKYVRLAANIGIVNIDDAAEKVTINFILQTQYYVTPDVADADNKYGPVLDLDFKEYLPAIAFRNGTEVKAKYYPYVDKKTGFVYCVITGESTVPFRGEFLEFPFDRQLLRLNLMCLNAKLVAFGKKEAAYLVHITQSRWLLQDFTVEFGLDQMSSANFSILVARKTSYYIWKYCLPVYFILAANLAVLTLDFDDVAGRRAISVTLFLTLNTYRFTLQDGLTRANYLNYMDLFTILAFFTSFWFVMHNVLLERFTDTDNETLDDEKKDEEDAKAAHWDRGFQWAAFAFWTFVMILLTIAQCLPGLLRPTSKTLENRYKKANYEYELFATALNIDAVAIEGVEGTMVNVHG